MKKIVKRIMAVLMLVGMTSGMGACKNAKSDSSAELDVPDGIPDYEMCVDTHKVRFGAWCSPPPAGSYTGQTQSWITEESYMEIADFGLDFINGLYERNGSADVMKALDCAKKAGVKYLAYYPSFSNYANSEATTEMMYNSIKDVIEHEACMGIFCCDEPGMDGIKNIAKASKVFEEMQNEYGLTDKYLYTNLFPTYANATQLNTDDYRQYINTYAATVKSKMLSVDFYPFGFNGFNYTVSSGWLAQLELDQIYSQAYGKEHWEFLQASAVGQNYVPSYNEYALQAYGSMAFGAQVLQYFYYWTPAGDNYTDGMIASDGSKISSWYDGQRINAEIHNFDHVFMNYVDNWKGVMPVVGKNNERGENSAFNRLTKAIRSHERIKSISASEDAFVGCFKDADGYDGFLAVNYSIPAQNKSNEIDIKFNKASKAIVYLYGERSVVDLNGGVLNVTLQAGQGAFIIPVV